MSAKFFKEVVLPTTLTGAVMLCITTLGGPLNFASKIMEKTYPNGERVYRVVGFELVCDRCKREGKALECVHRLGELPYWHDHSKHRDLEIIMSDDAETFLRETRGLQNDGNRMPAFDRNKVLRLLEPINDYMHTEHEIPTLFMSIDPSAGGSRSDFAITTCFYTGVGNINCVIAGLEASSIKHPNEGKNMIRKHLAAVRQTYEGARNARVVFILESNLGFEAFHIEEDLISLGYTGSGYYVMKEDKERTGVRMNNNNKIMLGLTVKVALNNHTIRFHDQLVTVASDHSHNSPKKMKTLLVQELVNFARILIMPANPKDLYSEPKETYSGKDGLGKDDCVISLGWNLVMSRRYFERVRNKDL